MGPTVAIAQGYRNQAQTSIGQHRWVKPHSREQGDAGHTRPRLPAPSMSRSVRSALHQSRGRAGRRCRTAAAFYEDWFGATVVPSPAFPVPVAWLLLGKVQLHLVQHQDPPARAYHFGVAVEDRELFESLVLAGRPGGAPQPRIVPEPHLRDAGRCGPDVHDRHSRQHRRGRLSRTSGTSTRRSSAPWAAGPTTRSSRSGTTARRCSCLNRPAWPWRAVGAPMSLGTNIGATMGRANGRNTANETEP